MADSKYKPEYCNVAKEYAAMGVTNKMLAALLRVHEDTIYNWKKAHPEFAQALERAKSEADLEVENSLYKQAAGYDYETEEARIVKDKDGNERLEAVTVTKHVPPRVQATQFWLKNRRPEMWRDKQEIEHSGGGIESILAEVMNTSRGLPSEHPSADKHREEFLSKYCRRH